MSTVASPPAGRAESGTRRLRRGGVVRTVWSLAGPRRGVLARSIGWKVAQAVAQAVPVGVLVVLVDRVRTGGLDSTDLAWATAITATCVAAQWLFGYLANRSAWIATFEMFGDVRVRALDHLRRLPIGFHADRTAGDTVTALTQDVNTLETFTHEPMQQLIGALIAPVVVFAVLCATDVPMAFATITSVLAALPVFVWTNRVFRSLAARRQEQQAVAGAKLVEYVQGLPVIRAFRVTGERLTQFRSALDDYRRVNTALAVRLTPLGMTFVATVSCGIPFVLFVGALWLFGGSIDVGTFVVFAVLVLRVYQPLFAAAESFEHLRIADASLDRIARILDEPLPRVPARPVAVPVSHAVAFDGVTFGYDPGRPVLHDVTFDAAPASMTAIVGPSGAGKSTLLHLVARFHDVDAGAVRIGDVDVRDLTAEQLFDAVTVVFQDVYLFPGTIGDNIAFGNPHASRADVEAAARAARVHEFVSALERGYDTPVGEGGVTLSGGERQRVAIARAILKDAPVVLLDEATSAIDPTNERLVQAALAELVGGKTLLVVAHRLGTIRSADQILVLESGRIVERGGHDELLGRGGRYSRLWTERTRAASWRIGDRAASRRVESPG